MPLWILIRRNAGDNEKNPPWSRSCFCKIFGYFSIAAGVMSPTKSLLPCEAALRLRKVVSCIWSTLSLWRPSGGVLSSYSPSRISEWGLDPTPKASPLCTSLPQSHRIQEDSGVMLELHGGWHRSNRSSMALCLSVRLPIKSGLESCSSNLPCKDGSLFPELPPSFDLHHGIRM